jgi:sulfoxide reductase heme-binding subunit YedZ
MSQIDLWYATRATGIVALILLTGTVFLGILVAGRARSSLPAFARAEFHRRVSVVSVVFLALHVTTAVLDSYVHIGWLAVIVPFTSNYQRFWLALGTVATDLLLAVAISSLLRQHVPARMWRGLHWLAYLSWPVAISHALGMGTDAKLHWVLALVVLCIASVASVIVWRAVTGMRSRAARPVTIISSRRSLRLGVSKGDGS